MVKEYAKMLKDLEHKEQDVKMSILTINIKLVKQSVNGPKVVVLNGMELQIKDYVNLI